MLKRAVMALYGLHAHNPLIIHGDPRLANLIITDDDKLVWVDLSDTQLLSRDGNYNYALRQDISIFIQSVVGAFDNTSSGYQALCTARDLCAQNVVETDYLALGELLCTETAVAPTDEAAADDDEAADAGIAATGATALARGERDRKK